MKKLLTVALASALMLTGTDAFAQLSVGFGLDNTTNKTSNSGGNHKENLTGLYFGAEYNFELSLGFGIAPGVYYTTCSKNKHSSGVRHKRNDQAINIPVNLNYGFDLDPEIRIVLFTGPVVGFGTVSRDLEGNIYTNLFQDTDLSHFKLQWNFGFGAEMMERFRVHVGVARGLNNRNNSKSIAGTIHTHDFHVGISYLLF